VVAVGAWQITTGNFVLAAVILILGMPLDALDGATARAYGKFRPFGSFLDSTLDRYADALVFGAFALYYANADDLWMVGASLVALHGAMTISYARAKAEALDLTCEVGLLSRMERVVIVLLALVLSTVDLRLTAAGVMILAVGTQFTALQRIVHVATLTRK
jgi:CDP-diacylglycerol--glycerol-3-phosphate 3-phosphatidyltransferase